MILFLSCYSSAGARDLHTGTKHCTSKCKDFQTLNWNMDEVCGPEIFQMFMCLVYGNVVCELYVRTYAHIRTYVCMHVCIYVCTHVCTDTYMYELTDSLLNTLVWGSLTLPQLRHSVEPSVFEKSIHTFSIARDSL